ncbi:ubiquitin-like protein Pup [Arcanobacterium haemolyticum]|uniref:Prokaryotic ubiquitin-like protein Pup n=1 Tax=Arcanobacterium haemolyticum (strain ATCC 9345 / DSM 20595 / CCM 5947 / CCUG 17215 / LMG 16163 / NBRC 15585 / NCTC 8452 / 11018) TaxID=644284 RepID=D7BNX9_ARCHD|nr:ubiquitin-like protein Pup [Arcanobacterium haemolyticum]ADH92628.1 protein of unknown function DUF797 [Arcanobacterium haemolyticum DSM 20595]QCX46739.1 ubiquitin-like protein Pup [Arcanobacterium haemolyticum]SPT74393.1 Bacterial ubiquitin-like modifier [Arcanobacterium haemolyticum]SQH28637.1 Bacterial ubiquitin-like modifier [Arcanobacterium haemolyticum]
MSEQDFLRHRSESQYTEETFESETGAAPFDVDALLDDIDSILETNASSFVQGFVQKGGQ